MTGALSVSALSLAETAFFIVEGLQLEISKLISLQPQYQRSSSSACRVARTLSLLQPFSVERVSTCLGQG